VDIYFKGDEAKQGLVELHSAGESLSGIGRVGELVSHYVSTDEVRFRAPYSNSLQFYVSAAQQGSVRFVVKEVSRLKNKVSAAAAQADAKKLLRRVIRRGIGKADSSSLKLSDKTVKSGEIDVLAEASEPALRRAHRWIAPGRKIDLDINNLEDVRFDVNTKDYLEFEEIEPVDTASDVSVAALNVNNRTGRVFMSDLGRTVPYKVLKDAHARTVPNLAKYLTQYAEKTGATVNIRFQSILTADGRLKRVLISDCYPIAGLN
jgi:hypothetical protein